MDIDKHVTGGKHGELAETLLDVLQQYPEGIAEFDLLRQLQCRQGLDAGTGLFGDDLAMFRAHFLLFHALYRLRDELIAEQRGLLDIHVLNIRLLPWRKASAQALAQTDPLRQYYLDLTNLEDTTLADVEAMLGHFWTRYFAGEQRAQALDTLGLSARVGAQEIEQRYRQLAMTHHPDRGGDLQSFQALQQAISVLRRSG